MNTLYVGGVEVAIDDATVQWQGALNVDGDGAPNCYGPPPLASLDYLANAGHGPRDGEPANWYGVVTDTGRPTGNPIVQGPSDPCPGFYVSQTALEDPSKRDSDPTKYVDASAVPYLSIPPELERWQGARLLCVGDVAIVTYRGLSSPAVVADVGGHGKLGEGSCALARALGLDPSPKDGGIGGGVSVVVWRGSSKSWPRSWQSVVEQVAGLMAVQTVS